jgi:hypothetical protein
MAATITVSASYTTSWGTTLPHFLETAFADIMMDKKRAARRRPRLGTTKGGDVGGTSDYNLCEFFCASQPEVAVSARADAALWLSCQLSVWTTRCHD